jgi:hypothetical protein
MANAGGVVVSGVGPEPPALPLGRRSQRQAQRSCAAPTAVSRAREEGRPPRGCVPGRHRARSRGRPYPRLRLEVEVLRFPVERARRLGRISELRGIGEDVLAVFSASSSWGPPRDAPPRAPARASRPRTRRTVKPRRTSSRRRSPERVLNCVERLDQG